MDLQEKDKQPTQEKLNQLKMARVQVKRALEEVEDKPKSEHSEETINRLRAQLEKINSDLVETYKKLGKGSDLEMMDILMDIGKDKGPS